jgi:hypothetical protein
MLSKTTLPQADAMILVLPEYNYGSPIFWNENEANGDGIFDASSRLKELASGDGINKFLRELLWMATALRFRRESLLAN